MLKSNIVDCSSSFEEENEIKSFPYTDVEAKDAEGGSLKLGKMTHNQGGESQNFAMRLFEMEAGGHSPLHCHFWEHEPSYCTRATANIKFLSDKTKQLINAVLYRYTSVSSG